jgi:hypothetical protein
MLAAPTFKADVLCGPCPQGTWQPLDKHREDTCRPQPFCGPGQRAANVSVPADTQSTCEACPPYEYQFAQLHHQQSCSAQPQCGPGEQYVDNGAGAVATCEPCNTNDYQDGAVLHRLPCQPQPACSSGQRANPPIRADKLRTCVACPQGQWEPHGTVVVF